MTIKTWADPVVRVNKVKEDELKNQLRFIHDAIYQKEDEIKVMKNILSQNNENLQNAVKKNVSPQIIPQFTAYAQTLRQKIQFEIGNLRTLHEKKEHINTIYKSVAQKRILLEGIQKKGIQKILKERENKEELFISDITQAEFIEGMNDD